MEGRCETCKWWNNDSRWGRLAVGMCENEAVTQMIVVYAEYGSDGWWLETPSDFGCTGWAEEWSTEPASRSPAAAAPGSSGTSPA
jgi:hypothetical protein